MFGMFGSKKSVPRWGFSAGWDDYLAAVKSELTRRDLSPSDAELRTGRILLPDPAEYEEWDLEEITARCRALEPHEWPAALRASLDEAIGSSLAEHPYRGRDGCGADDGDDEGDESRTAHERDGRRFDPPLEPSHLRVQLFAGPIAATFSENVASRPLGDAALVVVADLGFGEHTLTWNDLAELGLSRDEAFALGQRNAAANMAAGIHTETLALPGAIAEVLVANGFFLVGALLELRRRMEPGRAFVIAPITWHHIISFALQPNATRESLGHMRELTARIAGNITTIRNASAWVTRSLWWWPTGAARPVVLADDDSALPIDLAKRFGA